MNLAISIINSKYYRMYGRLIVIMLAMRGVFDTLYYFISTITDPFWAYGWLFALVFALFVNTCLIIDNVCEVKKYYMDKFKGDLYHKYIGIVRKDWNSKKNDYLFTIADALHQGLSFSEVKRYVIKMSQGYYSLAIRKGKNKKKNDFDLVLVQMGSLRPKKIFFTKDKDVLGGIAARKVETCILKYLEESNEGTARSLLQSALFALKWMSLEKINFQIRLRTTNFDRNRKIEIEAHHEVKEYGGGEYVSLRLIDKGTRVTYLEIYKKGFVASS